jgi:putative addiction module component (TIGR02574 family)
MRFVVDAIHLFVLGIATRGVDVVGELTFHVDQPATARAVCPMVERGEGDEVCLTHAVSATISTKQHLQERVMAAILKELETQALQLTPQERGELIHRLIVSLEGDPEDTPEAIAQAWDEEIARRVADMEAGCAVWIPEEEVFARLDAIIEKAR